jgi:uncharacterized membrane protein HdeD (DUF308 family)
MTPTPATPRPKAVDIAFWLLIAGAVLLVINGLMAATLNFEGARSVADASMSDEKLQSYITFQRGAGILSIVIGAAMGFMAGKTRKGDPRFKRATIAFAVSITVLVVAAAVVVKLVHLLALIAVLPIVFGALALTRPAASAWFDERAHD